MAYIVDAIAAVTMLGAIAEEGYCFGSLRHVPFCNGKTHSCSKCGMFLGPCSGRGCVPLFEQQ